MTIRVHSSPKKLFILFWIISTFVDAGCNHFFGGYLLIIDSFIIIDMNYVTKNKNKKKRETFFDSVI